VIERKNEQEKDRAEERKSKRKIEQEKDRARER
jgi:hypothetical protein